MRSVFVVNNIVVGMATIYNPSVIPGHQDPNAIRYDNIQDDVKVGIGSVVSFDANNNPMFGLPPVKPPIVGSDKFRLMFTPQEWMTCKSNVQNDVTLAYIFDMIDDPKTDTIDLSLKAVQGAIQYALEFAASRNVLAPGETVQSRLSEILTGNLQ